MSQSYLGCLFLDFNDLCHSLYIGCLFFKKFTCCDMILPFLLTMPALLFTTEVEREMMGEYEKVRSRAAGCTMRTAEKHAKLESLSRSPPGEALLYLPRNFLPRTRTSLGFPTIALLVIVQIISSRTEM